MIDSIWLAGARTAELDAIVSKKARETIPIPGRNRVKEAERVKLARDSLTPNGDELYGQGPCIWSFYQGPHHLSALNVVKNR